MPLYTKVIRNGESVPLRWGHFHIASMALATLFDSGQKTPDDVYEEKGMFECYPDAPFPVTHQLAFLFADYGALSKTPLADIEYVLKQKQHFRDIEDGELFPMYPGDILMAWRGFR